MDSKTATAGSGERAMTLVAWTMLIGIIACATSSTWIPWLGEPSEWGKPEGFTAAGTLLLAAFTLGLWLATYRLYREALESSKTASIAAKAAALTADAMLAAERAYFFVQIVECDWTLLAKGVQAKIRISNYGKTPGEIRGIRCGMLIAEASPPLKLGGVPEDRLPPGIGLAPSAVFDHTLKPFHMEDGVRRLVQTDQKRLYCVGDLQYEDVMGRRHETSFCWVLYPEDGQFFICSNSGLNKRT